MVTNAQAMACGACGHGFFRMFHQPVIDSFRLIAECAHCKSTSNIEPSPPRLTIGFGENSEGTLCRMDPKT